MPTSFVQHQDSTHHLNPTHMCKAQGKTSFGTYKSAYTTPSSILVQKSSHRPPFPEVRGVNRTTYSYPSYHPDNYLTDDGKSHVYRGAGWYTPSERKWHKYHEHTTLAPLGRRDAIDFQSEEEFRNFQKKRDVSPGLKLSGVPENRLFGYTRTLPDFPPQGRFEVSWPKSDAFFPVRRGERGHYYGVYHEYLAGAEMARQQYNPFPSYIKPELL